MVRAVGIIDTASSRKLHALAGFFVAAVANLAICIALTEGLTGALRASKAPCTVGALLAGTVVEDTTRACLTLRTGRTLDVGVTAHKAGPSAGITSQVVLTIRIFGTDTPL